jgi:hypothetical protein
LIAGYSKNDAKNAAISTQSTWSWW